MLRGELTRKRTFTEIDVTVEVDITDLAENGWHHEDDCPSAQPERRASTEAVAQALASLHRQAHPSQAADPLVCCEEPCRSLSYDEIRPEAIGQSARWGAGGRTAQLAPGTRKEEAAMGGD